MQETIDYFNITPNFKEKVEGLELPLEQWTFQWGDTQLAGYSRSTRGSMSMGTQRSLCRRTAQVVWGHHYTHTIWDSAYSRESQQTPKPTEELGGDDLKG